MGAAVAVLCLRLLGAGGDFRTIREGLQWQHASSPTGRKSNLLSRGPRPPPSALGEGRKQKRQHILRRLELKLGKTPELAVQTTLRAKVRESLTNILRKVLLFGGPYLF